MSGNDRCENSMPPPVFRFAPSPNGYLHLGHALSALLNFDSARRTGGRFLLRIEDIDLTRCRPEFETAIYEDLAWLGIAWETPVRRQSEHLAEYRDAVEKLSAEGLVYPSFESRGGTWRRRARVPAILPGWSTARDPMARPAGSPPGRRPGVTSSWRERRRRPAIISRW
jgi:glutamyl-Q tRNA(Asp) synthetase